MAKVSNAEWPVVHAGIKGERSIGERVWVTGRGGATSAEIIGGVVGSSSPGKDGSQLARGGSVPLRGGEEPEVLVGEGDEWVTGMAEG